MRKLATFSAAFSAAVFLAHYLVPPGFYLLSAGICALLACTAAFFKGDTRRRTLLITLSAALGFTASFTAYQNKTLPARSLSGTEISAAGTVTDYPDAYGDYTTVQVSLTGENVPHVRALLYFSGERLPDLRPGDEVAAEVKLKSSDERYGQAYSGRTAEGVYLIGYVQGNIKITGRSPLSFLYFPKTLASAVNAYAAKVFSVKTVPFTTALLTGDTTLIYQDSALYAYMAEAGLLHVVAVSGMNVAFIIGFIQLIVRRKRLASLIGIPMIILFVPFAGATPSVCRAAFMQIMVLSAPLLRRENDGVTSLTAVLAFLLLLNPNACASVGLQLSFAATLGIILVTPPVYLSLAAGLRTKRGKAKGFGGLLRKSAYGLLDGVAASFASTIGALVFTTPVSVMYFGYVSLIGILVNILVFWAISAAFILGYISCLLGMLLLPLGKAAGALTSLLVRYIMLMAKLGAAVPYGAIYTKGNIFGYWVILCYAIFILCLAFRRKEGFRPVLPVCLALSSLCCVILLSELNVSRDAGSFTAADVGQGQSLILTCGGATAVIDCGGKNMVTNAGDTVTGILVGGGRQSVDILALTHFDDDHVNGVIRLMSRMTVRRLVIPDVSEEEKTDIAGILAAAKENDTQVYIIKDDTAIRAGGLKILAYPETSQKQHAMMYLGEIASFDAFISGDADASVEKKFLEAHTLPDTGLYVAGHHGSKNSSSEALLSALHAEYAVISCGYNTYGHPAPETIERLKNAGMKIFRTDEDGNITVRIKERSGVA